MAAYVISDVEVLDTALMEKYRSLAPATIAKYGGHYLVRGGAIEPVEGDWVPKHLAGILPKPPTCLTANKFHPLVIRYANGLADKPVHGPFIPGRLLCLLETVP